MKLGIYDGSGALTAQQKILAAQAAIYKQTGDAQGDFILTQDNLANKTRTLDALFKNLQIRLGQELLPAATNFANGLVKINDAFGNMIEPARKATGELGGFVNQAIKGINPLYLLSKGIQAIGSGFFDAKEETGAYNKALGLSAQQAMRVADAGGALRKGLNDTGTGAGGAKKEVESFATALKEKLGEAVDTAKEKLAEAQGEFDGFATKVSDAVKGALDFNAALESGDYGFKGFLDALRDQVKGVVEYSVNLGKALEMGLSQDALSYVLDAGNVAGAEIALELIKGGQTAINETNALVEAAKQAADKVGIQAANRFYKAGVDQAKFIVDGLQAELNKLTPKLMAQMDAIAAKLKRNVDIDVIITERVNKVVTTITGAAPGLPTTTLPKIVTPIVPLPAPRPIDRPGAPVGALGTSGVTVNVTGGLSTSAEIGQSVVNALRAYSRTAGPLQLNVA